MQSPLNVHTLLPETKEGDVQVGKLSQERVMLGSQDFSGLLALMGSRACWTNVLVSQPQGSPFSAPLAAQGPWRLTTASSASLAIAVWASSDQDSSSASFTKVVMNVKMSVQIPASGRDNFSCSRDRAAIARGQACSSQAASTLMSPRD